MQLINGLKAPTVTATSIQGFFGPYWFLSNFYRQRLELDGIVYPSSEHAYLAEKCTGYKLRVYIASIPEPLAAQEFGQGLQLPYRWDELRLQAMRRVIQTKFTRPDLAQLLLNTGERYLEKTNDWGDRFWGVYQGEGSNHLGLLLMEERARLREVVFQLPAAKPNYLA